MRTTSLEKWIIAVAISGLPFSEAARKFLFPSQNFLVFYELMCVGLALLMMPRTLNKKVADLILIFGVVFAWGLISSMTSGSRVELLFLGVRSYIFPLAWLVLGVRLRQIASAQQIDMVAFKFLIFWMAIITLIAILQIYVGPTHFLTVGVGRDEAIGLGSWGADTNLFRATSIFQHTGKYGQIIFLFCAYSAYLRTRLQLKIWVTISAMTLELLAILISGQRIGVIFFIVILLVLNINSFKNVSAMILFLFAFVFLSLVTSNQAFEIVFRVSSIFDEIPTRLYDNLILPLTKATENHLLVGVGFGALSFGSQAFGGELLTAYIKVGNAENSYVRIIVETGLFGLVLSVIFFSHLILTTLAKRCAENTYDKTTKRFLVSIIISIMIWGNTHDTLGATATTGILFFIVSIAYTRMPRH